MKKILLTAAALGMVVGFAATASATNGYFSHAYSIKNKGMAGAGVAAPLDAMVPATNPAGLTEVGNRLDVGLAIFNPNREYTVVGGGGPGMLNPGTVESDSEYFFIPNIGWSKQLNEKSAIGIAMYGNGGMNTDYPVATFANFGAGTAPTGVDLMQLFIAPTYAIKVKENHSLGLTPIIAAQFFSAQGLQAFAGGFSATPASVTNNGHDSSYGFGARVGYLGKINDQFSIGAAVQTKIIMDEFDDYAGLFAEQGDFDIPSNWTVGFAFMPTPTVTVAVDVQQIQYSNVDSIGNPMLPNLFAPGLGPDGGAGFGWDDMTVFKVGLQWDRTEKWTYRFGYSYGEQPIESTEVMFNILAPGVIEQHATFGFTYTFDNQAELDFSLTYAFEEDVSGPHPFGAPQVFELAMNQWEVGFGYSWKF